MLKDTFKNALNVNRTKYNTWRRQENYILWKHQKAYGKKSVSMLLDYYQNQMERTQ